MCKRLALLLPLLLAMCAAPLTWQKPGVDNTTLTKDTSDCRASAEREAVRRYPHGFYAPAASGTVAASQRDETNRSTVEASLFNACMEAKGYTRS